MSRDKQQQGKGFLAGIIIGSVAGVVTALLLSPRSGDEIRSNLNRQSITLKKRSTDFAQTAKEKSSTIAKSVSQSNVVNKVKDWRPARSEKGHKTNSNDIDIKQYQNEPRDYDEHS